MPTYIYEREDGSRFEIKQRITEDALAVCPDTGMVVKRVISAPAVVFKGSGFYQTDYKPSGSSQSSSQSSSKSSQGASSDSGSSAESCNGKGPESGCGACSTSSGD